MKKWIVFVSFIMLAIALVISISWIWSDGGFEPVITSILIFTAIISFFVEKWLNNRSRRKELLHALIHELYINSSVLSEAQIKGKDLKKIKIFRRLSNSMVESCFISGCFNDKADAKLFNLLHDWKIFSTQYNLSIGVTEQAIMLNPNPENIAVWNDAIGTGKTFKQIKDKFTELGSHLLDNYSQESGISDETVLFSDRI